MALLLGQNKPSTDILKPRYYEPTQLNDSTVIIGELTSNSFIGKNTVGCTPTNGQSVSSGLRVYVVGYKECDKNDPINGFFYEIIYDTLPYFVYSKYVELKGITLSQFKSINYNQFYKIGENAFSLTERGINPIDFDREGLIAQNKAKKDKVEEIKKAKADSIQAQNFLKSCKTSGIVLCDYIHYDESEYTEGTSISFKYYNPTSKTIKYIWTTFAGINPVGDKVCEKRNNTCNVRVESVGPIKPMELATYEYSYIWLSDLVEKVKIISIEVQYMDGTKKKILNPNTVKLSKTNLEILGGEYGFDTLRSLIKYKKSSRY